MDEKEFTANYLRLCGVKNVEALNDEQFAIYYDELYDCHGDVETIYNECNQDERVEFIAALRDSVANGERVQTYRTHPEGVLTEDCKTYFEFCTRHSMWYQIT